ncbi:hypothetical protein MMC34_002272, partial [Xylographa carneopallida]|nr:hypothetical protein [Xylographa carneopallida]
VQIYESNGGHNEHNRLGQPIDCRSAAQFFCAWEHCWEFLNEEYILDDDSGVSGVDSDDVQTGFDNFDVTGMAEDEEMETEIVVNASSELVLGMDMQGDEYNVIAEANISVMKDDWKAAQAGD